MTKAEILEAINATIRPNNQKGITAESLANILTEIVNASAESGGSSGGGSGYYIDMTLANPDDEESMDLTADAMAHNAQLYATLMSVYSAGTVSAAGPVSALVPEMGFITSNAVMFDTDAIMVAYAVPMELNNVMVNAVDMTSGGQTTTVLGSFITFVIGLMPDGSAILFTPGLT